MTRTRRLAVGLLAGGALVSGLGACSSPSTPTPEETSQSSSQLNDTFTSLMPRLVGSLSDGASMKYQRVREESCGRPDEGEPAAKTAWIGWASGKVTSHAAVNRALTGMDTYLRSDGWEKKREVAEADNHPSIARALYYHRDGLDLTAEVQRTGNGLAMDLNLESPCTDQPSGHQLEHSRLDPDGGTKGKAPEGSE